MPRRGLAGIAEANGLGSGQDFGFGTGNVRPTLTPYGTLSVPDMHGRPSYFPAIDIPMGQSDPSVTFDPRYTDNIGLSLNPNNQVDTGRPGFSQFFRYLTDPTADPGQGGGSPGRNIPPNEDVAPPNNDYFYPNDVYAPGGVPGSPNAPSSSTSGPNLRNAPTVTPDGYYYPGDVVPPYAAGESGYPMPGGWSRKAGSSFDPNTGMNWANNATNTDAHGYPIPGVGGSPAGDWRSNATRPPITMTSRGPMGQGTGGGFGLIGRGFAGPYGGGNSFGQGVGDFGVNPSGNWGAQAWNFGGVSAANLSLGIDPGAMMYRGHLAS